MTFRNYIIRYNMFEGLSGENYIDMDKVDFYEEKEASLLMDKYVEMLREKIRRKNIADCEETFVLTGMSEDEKYMYDSLAGTYIYENQYERKEIQSTIAELTGLSMKQVKLIALRNLGDIQDATKEEKKAVAKILTVTDKIEESEPNV